MSDKKRLWIESQSLFSGEPLDDCLEVLTLLTARYLAIIERVYGAETRDYIREAMDTDLEAAIGYFRENGDFARFLPKSSEGLN